jgi:hypothetical protein
VVLRHLEADAYLLWLVWLRKMVLGSASANGLDELSMPISIDLCINMVNRIWELRVRF